MHHLDELDCCDTAPEVSIARDRPVSSARALIHDVREPALSVESFGSAGGMAQIMLMLATSLKPTACQDTPLPLDGPLAGGTLCDQTRTMSVRTSH